MSQQFSKLERQYFLRQTAKEMILSSTPQQRVLLRILATCDQQNISPVETIQCLAYELPKSDHRRHNQLAERLLENSETLQAFENDPELLPPFVLAALRIADNDNTIKPLYAELLDHNVAIPAAEATEHNAASYVRLFGKILVVVSILTFFYVRVIPEFRDILAEFGLPIPVPVQILDSAMSFMPLVLMAFLFLLLAEMPSRVRQFFKRWSPLRWLQPTWMSAAQRKLILAYALQSDLPLKDNLNALINERTSSKQADRLKRAKQSLESGDRQWQAFCDCHMLDRREADALSKSDNRDTHSWLLRWSARHLQNRRNENAQTRKRILICAFNIGAALLTFLTALAVFGTVLSIIKSL